MSNVVEYKFKTNKPLTHRQVVFKYKIDDGDEFELKPTLHGEYNPPTHSQEKGNYVYTAVLDVTDIEELEVLSKEHQLTLTSVELVDHVSNTQTFCVEEDPVTLSDPITLLDDNYDFVPNINIVSSSIRCSTIGTDDKTQILTTSEQKLHFSFETDGIFLINEYSTSWTANLYQQTENATDTIHDYPLLLIIFHYY